MAMLTFTDSRPSTRERGLGARRCSSPGRRRVPVVRGVEVLAGTTDVPPDRTEWRESSMLAAARAQQRRGHGTRRGRGAGAQGSGGGSTFAAGGTHGGREELGGKNTKRWKIDDH